MQDVADALSAYAADSERARQLTINLRTAQDTAALSNDRYRAGVTTFLDVLQAQGAVTQAEDQLLSARSAQLADLTNLFTALGGGWGPDTPAA